MNKKVMSRGMLLCVFVLTINLLCACNSEVDLTNEQIESLCEQYAELDDSYADMVPTKAMAAIKVFGTQRDGNIGYIYCYASDGTYVKVNNKAYDTSGGIGPNILKIQFENANIVLLDRDDSVSFLDVLSRFPLKYRKMCKSYDKKEAYDEKNGYFILKKEEATKIEKFWGVPVEMEYCIDIFEDGTYEVWDFPDDEVIIIEKGKIEHD